MRRQRLGERRTVKFSLSFAPGAKWACFLRGQLSRFELAASSVGTGGELKDSTRSSFKARTGSH